MVARQEKQQLSEGEFWADKLMDLANLSVIVLVVSQLVVSSIRWGAFALGIAFYIFIAIISSVLRRR